MQPSRCPAKCSACRTLNRRQFLIGASAASASPVKRSANRYSAG